MLTSNKLITFKDVVEKAEEDLYAPGEIVGAPFPRSDELDNHLYIPRYSTEMVVPSIDEEADDRLPPRISGTELKRFQTGKSLRVWGKERIARALNLIPDQIYGDYEVDEFPPESSFVVDGVPNFKEVGFGQGNLVQDSSPGPSRDETGMLISTLTQVASQYFDIQKRQYQPVVQTPSQASMGSSLLGGASTLSNYLPYIIIGGIALLMLKGGRKVI